MQDLLTTMVDLYSYPFVWVTILLIFVISVLAKPVKNLFRVFIKGLGSELLKENSRDIWSILGTISSLIAALVAIAMAFLSCSGKEKSLWEAITGQLHHFEIVSVAFASSGGAQVDEPIGLIAYIVGGIFIVIFLTFLMAAGVMLFTKDESSNQKKLSSADGIIKTFGGFFIGVATSYANQAMGIV